MPNYLIILILAFLSGITTLIGAGFALYLGENKKAISVGIGFSAGIMILISLFELVPESVVEIDIFKTVLALLFGALLIYILNIIIPHTHLIEEAKGKKGALIKTAYLVAFGLILHDFPEGFAMANSYLVAPSTGILIAIAIALHNIPEEFAMAVPIVAAKKGKKFLYTAAFLSGLAEPLGAVIGLVFAGIFPALKPFFLAFAAGAMIFIALHELYPMAKIYKKIPLFILGIIISGIVYIILATLVPG
jgi:ZIP family zinc transporter